MTIDETSAALRNWFATQLDDVDDVRVEGLDRVAHRPLSGDDPAHAGVVRPR